MDVLIVCVAEEYPDRIVNTDGRLVQWTADWPTDARVEFLSPHPLSLQLRCSFRKANVTVKKVSVISFMTVSPGW